MLDREQKGVTQSVFLPTSVKSQKIFKASRQLPLRDKRFFLFKILKADTFSLGIVATKKLGCAVKRNFIKRRIRSAFMSAAKNVKCTENFALIVIAKRETATVNFVELVKAFQSAIEAGINEQRVP